jgi:hypothetical protein
VKLDIPLGDGLALTIADESSGSSDYPTGRLQKGLLLLDRGRGLAEEGVGFGVPVLKCGVKTIFAGGLELTCERRGPVWEVTAVFEMNLVERLARRGSANLRSRSLYAAKNSLAALHRRAPALRGPLTATSRALRRSFGWVTTFEETGPLATMRLTYTIHEGQGRVGTAVGLTELPPDVSEVVVMNEQGARRFDRYVDAAGAALQGAAIGTWDEVGAATASFVSAADGVAFTLGQAEGARLHRGRELIGSRVAWSGFGYSFPPTLAEFGYELEVARVT